MITDATVTPSPLLESRPPPPDRRPAAPAARERDGIVPMPGDRAGLVPPGTEILCNAANHETFVFEGSAGDEDAAFRIILGTGGTGGGNALVHVHPLCEETFHVISGRLTVVVHGRERMIEAGETATVPRGAPHHFRNGHDGMTECAVRFSPPQRQRRFFRNFATLAERRPDWFSAAGDPRPLLTALVLHRYADHLYLAGIPIRLQKVIFAVLAPLARWRGYRLAVEPDGTTRDVGLQIIRI